MPANPFPLTSFNRCLVPAEVAALLDFKQKMVGWDQTMELMDVELEGWARGGSGGAANATVLAADFPAPCWWSFVGCNEQGLVASL